MSARQATYGERPHGRVGAGALIVGLDPGLETGVAVYDAGAGRLLRCCAMGFWAVVELFEETLLPVGAGGAVALVVVEDARGLPLYGRHDRVRGRRRDRLARRVGGIDRDVALWAVYLGRRGYRVSLVEPMPGQEKWSAAVFRRVTRWQGRTNQHGRDAARLVWGRGVDVPEALLTGKARHPSARAP